MPQALFPEVFRLHGRWRPTREAVVCGDRRLNWRDFNSRINQVANAALGEGLKQGDRVIVLMANGIEMLETLFGLIKAGLTSVPINLSVTEDAIAGMVQDADARLIVCTEDQARRIEAHTTLATECGHLTRVSTGDVQLHRVNLMWKSNRTHR